MQIYEFTTPDYESTLLVENVEMDVLWRHKNDFVEEILAGSVFRRFIMFWSSASAFLVEAPAFFGIVAKKPVQPWKSEINVEIIKMI